MGTITELQTDIRNEMFGGQTVNDDLILGAIGEAIDGIQYAVGADAKPILWDFLKTQWAVSMVSGTGTFVLSGVAPSIRDIDYISVIDNAGESTPIKYMEYQGFLETYRNAINNLPETWSLSYPQGATATIHWGPAPNQAYTATIDYYQRHATTGSTTILVPNLELVKRGAKMRIALDQDNADVAKMNLEIYDRLFANLMARQQRFEIPRYTVPVY